MNGRTAKTIRAFAGAMNTKADRIKAQWRQVAGPKRHRLRRQMQETVDRKRAAARAARTKA